MQTNYVHACSALFDIEGATEITFSWVKATSSVFCSIPGDTIAIISLTSHTQPGSLSIWYREMFFFVHDTKSDPS